MMFTTFTTKFFLLLMVFSVVACQYGNEALTNYQLHDQSRQEVTDERGNVQGQYSYVDPNGKTISVKYTAGKDGFQVHGQHIPNTKYISKYYQPRNKYYQAKRPDPYSNHYQYPIHEQSAIDPTAVQPQHDFQPYQPKYTQTYPTQSEPHALFAPAHSPYSAASAGQLKSYHEALAEEEEQHMPETENDPSAQSHVNVHNTPQGYSYDITL